MHAKQKKDYLIQNPRKIWVCLFSHILLYSVEKGNPELLGSPWLRLRKVLQWNDQNVERFYDK